MRKFIDIINESLQQGLSEYAREQIFVRDQEPVIIATNPTATEIKKLTDNSLREILRGYYDDDSDNAYFWDAYEANHDDFTKAVGLEYEPDNRFDVAKVDDTLYLMSNVHHEKLDNLIDSHPYFSKIAKPTAFKGKWEISSPSKLKEYVSMKVYTDAGRPVAVYMNPKGPELQNLVNNSPAKEFRGYYATETNAWYFWGDENLYHEDFTGSQDLKDALGTFFEYNKKHVFYIAKNLEPWDYSDVIIDIEPGRFYLSHARTDKFPTHLLDHPYLQKWFEPYNPQQPDILLMKEF